MGLGVERELLDERFRKDREGKCVQILHTYSGHTDKTRVLLV